MKPLLLAAALLALSLPAIAQDEMPAVSSPVAPAAKPPRETTGTVLVGDRDETPYGLYFFPWREAKAEADIDRPARLLQEKLLPLDEDVFLRQVEYHGALSSALKSKNTVTPAGR